MMRGRGIHWPWLSQPPRLRRPPYGWAQRHPASAGERHHPDGHAGAGHPGPETSTGWPQGGDAGYLADDAPAPGSVRLQLNALQALCRQAFAVRLAAIAIGAPFAMSNATDGPPRYAVLAAAVLGVMGSYAMLRDWDRFGPRLLAHPTLMAVDLTFGAILLLTASPASPSPTQRSAPPPRGPAVRLARLRSLHRHTADRPPDGVQGMGPPPRGRREHPPHRGLLHRRRRSSA